jgi:hypothetical protein
MVWLALTWLLLITQRPSLSRKDDRRHGGCGEIIDLHEGGGLEATSLLNSRRPAGVGCILYALSD